MLRYGEKLDLDKNLWDAIVTYMNDDIREDVHFDLAPCSEEEFLDEYVKRDPEFENCCMKNLASKWRSKMRAYKLLRKLSDGNLYPLFIHKTYSTPINEWMQAECYPTKGFAVRCGWHT